MPIDGGHEVFNLRAPDIPTTCIYTIRPYQPEDEVITFNKVPFGHCFLYDGLKTFRIYGKTCFCLKQNSLYEICVSTCDDWQDGHDLFPCKQFNMAGDRLVE